ncbi:MAG: hypothetical protein AAFX99_19050 [Myxococcota bacterium]
MAFAARGKLDLNDALASEPEAALGFKLLDTVDDTEPRTPPAIPPGARGPKAGGCASCSASDSGPIEASAYPWWWVAVIVGVGWRMRHR